MSQATMEAPAPNMPAKTNGKTAERQADNLPALRPSRLPLPKGLEQQFGIDPTTWRALVEAIFPSATCPESVVLALSYCKARKLDPFKRNVHIVPIYDKNRRCMVDTIWPGIGELRTTAFRTGEYAGRDQAAFGPTLNKKLGGWEGSFPEWAQVTVHRMVKGQRVAFAGPQVYWLETYATAGRDTDAPNDMWATRPRGQIEKCAEAAALRAAFPEEIGSDYIPEEISASGPVGTRTKQVESTPAKPRTEALLDKLTQRPVSEGQTLEPDPEYVAQVQREEATEQLGPSEQPAADAPVPELESTAPEPDVQGVTDSDIEAPPDIKPTPLNFPDPCTELQIVGIAAASAPEGMDPNDAKVRFRNWLRLATSKAWGKMSRDDQWRVFDFLTGGKFDWNPVEGAKPPAI